MAIEIEGEFDFGGGGSIIRVPDAGTGIEADITGQTASTLHGCEIDCTNNPGEEVYVRFWDESSTPTLGTTAARVLLAGNKGRKIGWYNLRGIVWTNTMYVACVTTPGATSGAGSPTGTVVLRIFVVGVT